MFFQECCLYKNSGNIHNSDNNFIPSLLPKSLDLVSQLFSALQRSGRQIQYYDIVWTEKFAFSFERKGRLYS